MSTTYTPQPGSLASRVCTFFVTHPEEELSSRDICIKFGVESINGISALLASPLAAQLVARTKDPDTGAMFWVAGPKLAAAAISASLPAAAFGVAAAASPALPPAPALTPAPAPAAAPKAAAPRAAPHKRGSTRLPALDITTVQAKPGTPPPGRQIVKGLTRYDELFAKLDKPGLCIEVPAAYQATLDKAKTVYAKRFPGMRLSVRRIDDTTCGVFRIA